MNVFASDNVLFDGVFCRNSDDCTTVYATRLGHAGGCKNITMQNSTLWADVAHPIFIGLHGDPGKFEIMEDLTYKNIDILDHSEMQVDYQGCMAINAGDNNLVRNVRFENLRVNGELITDDMPGKPAWYHTGDMARIYVGPHVEDIVFTQTK